MSHSLVVFEDHGWQRLLPLVYTRATFQLLCGAGDLLSKIARLAGGAGDLAVWCRPALGEVVARQTGRAANAPPASGGRPALLLNGRGLWRSLPPVGPGESAWVGTVGDGPDAACVWADGELAARLSPSVLLDAPRARAALAGLPRRDVSAHVRMIDWPWQLIHANAATLADDWAAGSDHRGLCGTIDSGSHLLAPEAVHVGRGSRVKPCVVIDAEGGPVWIGERVTIQPHCYVQGPAYIGDGVLLQAGTSVRAGTTIGPCSKVGGEVESSIIHGYSNKQHDGFLGHSYVGAWVNLGADCLNSDLKNTYGSVRVPINGREVETGETFVGMLVGDHGKAGINVAFPTGAVVGFCSSVAGARCPKFVPSFTWIDGETVEPFDESKGLATARKVMGRRGVRMTPAEEAAFLGARRQALAIEHRDRSLTAETEAMWPAVAFRKAAA